MWVVKCDIIFVEEEEEDEEWDVDDCWKIDDGGGRDCGRDEKVDDGWWILRWWLFLSWSSSSFTTFLMSSFSSFCDDKLLIFKISMMAWGEEVWLEIINPPPPPLLPSLTPYPKMILDKEGENETVVTAWQIDLFISFNPNSRNKLNLKQLKLVGWLVEWEI